MTRPGISPVRIDPTTDKNFSAIRAILCGGVDLSNLNVQTIEGTTADTSDTEKRVQHSMSPQPASWFPLLGDVYVQDITSDYIDVRSTKPGVNFKIILVGGPQVTTTALTTVGGSAYKDTTGLIEENAPEVGGINISGGIVVAGVGPSQGTGSNNGSGSGQVLSKGNYFYITPPFDGGGDAGTSKVTRYDRTTGVRDSIAFTACPGAGAMFADDTYLYISTVLSTSAVKIYQIALSTFTLTSTISFTMAIRRISDLYVNATHIYLAGCSSNTGNGAAVLGRATIAGGSPTVLTLGAATPVRIATRMLFSTTEIGVVEFISSGNVSASQLYKVDIATFAVTSTIVNDDNNLVWSNAVVANGSVWIPACYNASMTAVGTTREYSSLLYKLDLATEVFTEYPIPFVPTATINRGLTYLANVITNDDYIYLIGTSGDTSDTISTHGVYIMRFDALDETFSTGWFPWMCGGNTMVSGNHRILRENIMTNDDLNGGVPILFSNGSASASPEGIHNFEYFRPDFSNF